MTVDSNSTERGDQVDERGVLLTAEGRQRARQQLAEAAARWTPEERRDNAEKVLQRLRGHAA